MLATDKQGEHEEGTGMHGMHSHYTCLREVSVDTLVQIDRD